MTPEERAERNKIRRQKYMQEQIPLVLHGVRSRPKAGATTGVMSVSFKEYESIMHDKRFIPLSRYATKKIGRPILYGELGVLEDPVNPVVNSRIVCLKDVIEDVDTIGKD